MRVNGVARMVMGQGHAVCVDLDREPTDDELRELHDVLRAYFNGEPPAGEAPAWAGRRHTECTELCREEADGRAPCGGVCARRKN